MTTELEWAMDAECRRATKAEAAMAYGSERDMFQFVDTFCAFCPVIEECREVGMADPNGVWGGLLPRDRMAIRARRARSKTDRARRARKRAEREQQQAEVLVS